ncbi:biopolymer transporter ExbD [Thermosynechococcaceae cyanobacterium BACA0444]|uniref:Biopolymer transporter ExbD n=1 Tax=Pseudocalidococcus azoricus BACA0444 TaxID=2918990 RepID=A0AAE4FVX0_9CYAN|nr:biopolymer transporter ExbD [Pseudocalidococcus azoricus]MDS3862284.1 biopolymer transporter ExbD [Pseudocalidococcus azoricus BACA0444]
MFRLEDEQDGDEINIVPMIDVVFSVLAFFIIASLFLSRTDGIDIKLPQATTTQTQPNNPITVTIDRNRNIFINGDGVEIAQVQARIVGLKTATANQLVIVRADTAVEHGTVIAVMDELRQIKNVQLAISTRKSGNN